jgi:L-iditol 2-dehydrogenase
MKCVRLYGPNDLRIESIPVPEIREDEVLLKTSAVAVCGSDIRMWKNGYAGVDGEHPLILGHEFSGIIEKVGGKVPFYQVGMKVSLQPNIGCGVCDRCVAGNFHLCNDYQAFGINMDGAMAEYVKIPASALLRGNLAALSQEASLEEAAVAEPMSCAYNGFLKMSAQTGEYAMVVGAGPIGISHSQLLHLAGCHVILCDLSAERLAECKRIMPYIQIVVSGEMKERVNEITKGRGLDIAIIACPAPSMQAAVLELMNYGGRVNYFGGIPQKSQPVAIDTNLIHYRELFITGSTRSSISQYRKTLEMLTEGQLDAKSIITHRYPIDEALTAFQNAAASVGLKHILVFES